MQSFEAVLHSLSLWHTHAHSLRNHLHVAHFREYECATTMCRVQLDMGQSFSRSYFKKCVKAACVNAKGNDFSRGWAGAQGRSVYGSTYICTRYWKWYIIYNNAYSMNKDGKTGSKLCQDIFIVNEVSQLWAKAVSSRHFRGLMSYWLKWQSSRGGWHFGIEAAQIAFFQGDEKSVGL